MRGCNYNYCMEFTCDLVIEAGDGRHFEWVLIIRTDSRLDAFTIAESEVAKWDAAARIRELSIQSQDERIESGVDIYVALAREIILDAPQKDHVTLRLKAKLGISTHSRVGFDSPTLR